MKKRNLILILVSILILFILGIFIWNNTISNNSNINIENNNLWTIVTKPSFSDKKDIENFKQKIIDTDKKINSFTGDTTDLLIEKARYLDYIGETGKAIEIYENNLNKNLKYSVFLHNLSKLYEKVDRCDLANNIYDLLIGNLNKGEYYKDKAYCYKKLNDLDNAKKAALNYKDFMNTDQTLNVLTK